jgi:hypothetical protein
LSAEDFKIDDFVLYPNRIRNLLQFTSQSETGVKVLVHDLLGRKLFDKTYESNSDFNKKHSVAAIANRIYLLTVIDGDRKEVKKLVIE